MLTRLARFSRIATLISIMAPPTWAVDVSIANAGFEQVVLPCAPGGNCFSASVSGWTISNAAAATF